MMDDLIIRQPENLSLIRILDRAQPDYCEICGNHLTELFWTGKYMACVPCSKDASRLRAFGVFLPDGGITVKEFMRRFAENTKLQRRLFHGNSAR